MLRILQDAFLVQHFLISFPVKRGQKNLELNVKLQAFEGPLDLLLHLIDKNKVDIYDIPIAEITDQYMDYVRQMETENLDVMSEFLVMAATLLDIKARMLLPVDPDEEEPEDPRQELVDQLIQYKIYKYMSFALKDRQIDGAKRLYKQPTIPAEVRAYEEPVDLDELTQGMDLSILKKIFDDVIRRQSDKVDPIRSRFGQIKKEQVSMEERTKGFDSFIRKNKSFGFRAFLEEKNDREEIIVAFLIILEYMKSGKIRVSQNGLFDDILVESLVAE